MGQDHVHLEDMGPDHVQNNIGSITQLGIEICTFLKILKIDSSDFQNIENMDRKMLLLLNACNIITTYNKANQLMSLSNLH